jgi:FkbM family methyltransferase
MSFRFLHSAVARLPGGIQFEARRANYARQIRRGTFVPHDEEVGALTAHLSAGDWAVDIGANVGRYTHHMARCVGPTGRVLAFEPVAVSFALLTANMQAAGAGNVTLFNVALSSTAGIVGMTVPSYENSPMNNYYRAHLAAEGDQQVLSLPLDALPIPGRLRLVKIDAEGHDVQVLMGMTALLRRHRPSVIVEGWLGGEAAKWLESQAYSVAALGESANIIAAPNAPATMPEA